MNLILFALGTIGMSQIIVDGSIFEGPRNIIKYISKIVKLEHLGTIVDCYLCSGTWCGFLMGYIWISDDPFKIFACGCAGGFLSSLGSSFINLIESYTIGNLSNE